MAGTEYNKVSIFALSSFRLYVTQHPSHCTPTSSQFSRMHLTRAATLGLLIKGLEAAAVLRFGCSQITVERLDPYASYPQRQKSRLTTTGSSIQA